MASVFQLAKNAILRGPVLDWWVQKRARQLDSAYLSALVSTPGQARLPAPAIARPEGTLDRIVFIGDCMWEHDQLLPALRKIADVKVFDLKPHLAREASPTAAVRAVEEFIQSTSGYSPDLVVFYLRPSLLSDEIFSVIRKAWPCPLFGLNLDDRVEFFPYGILSSGNDNYARWISHFDLNLTSSLAAVDWYETRGANAVYFPQGFHPDPRFTGPPERNEISIPFSFVGSWKPERGMIVDQLEACGIAPETYGRGWKTSRWIEDPGTVFRSSQINLGIGYATASAKIANAKGRDVECPGTGACYLTTYHWEMAEMFEIGKEVLCYRNVEELVELHSYYSKRPDACLAIARAAHRRAHAEHTWESRLRKLFQSMGMKPRHC